MVPRFIVRDEVKDFLAEGWAKYIHLERFPAYAPELNPDEGVWQHFKHVELRNLCCTDLDHLRANSTWRSDDCAANLI